MSTVAVRKSNYQSVYQDIQPAIENGGGLSLKAGDTVVIKPNLCDFRFPESGAVTHPIFLDATLKYLNSTFKNLKIFVVESDATSARPDLLMKWLGFDSILRKNNATYVNLSKAKTFKKDLKGRYFKELDVPEILDGSTYFISMAKLKTAMVTKITCCLKNQFGCIPYWRKKDFHHKLDDIIVDSNLAMKPDFCIVDGIVAMGGTKGPNDGVPIYYNTIITSKDPVAVDSVCAKILGFSPYLIGHVRKAQASSLGRIRYDLIGNLADFKKDSEYSSMYANILKFTMYLKNKGG